MENICILLLFVALMCWGLFFFGCMICTHGYRCTSNLCLTSYIFSVQRYGMKAQGRRDVPDSSIPITRHKSQTINPFPGLTSASLHCFTPILPSQDASWSWCQWPLSLAGLWPRTGHSADHQHSGRIYVVLVVGEMWVEPPNRKPSRRMPAQSLDTFIFRFVEMFGAGSHQKTAKTAKMPFSHRLWRSVAAGSLP